MKLQGPKCHFRNLRGHFCKYFGTKNVRKLGPGGKSVILTKVRGQNCKISGRWSDQHRGSATSSDTVGPARTSAELAFGRAPGVRPKTAETSNRDSGFVSPPISTWFVPMCSKSRALQKPQDNFTKNEQKVYRFGQRRSAVAVTASDPFSGVVRPISWSGFDRGR